MMYKAYIMCKAVSVSPMYRDNTFCLPSKFLFCSILCLSHKTSIIFPKVLTGRM